MSPSQARLIVSAFLCSTLLLVACNQAPFDAVLSGRCEDGMTHCVDQYTIQFCGYEVWQDPQECTPDTAGSGGVQVEIITYCAEGGCRPAG